MIRAWRPGTDDEQFIIPELIEQDMYRLESVRDQLVGFDGSILDGGAHIGVASVLLAEHFPDRTIVAYEPEPENYALLCQNTLGYGRIVALPYALGVEAGWGSLYGQDGTGRYSMTPWSPQGEPQRVRVISFRDELERLAPVRLVKLDLEGAEADLLRELPAAFSTVRVLLLETHDWIRPFDHAVLERDGFRVMFHPYDDPRHTVYYRP